MFPTDPATLTWTATTHGQQPDVEGHHQLQAGHDLTLGQRANNTLHLPHPLLSRTAAHIRHQPNGVIYLFNNQRQGHLHISDYAGPRAQLTQHEGFTFAPARTYQIRLALGADTSRNAPTAHPPLDLLISIATPPRPPRNGQPHSPHTHTQLNAADYLNDTELNRWQTLTLIALAAINADGSTPRPREALKAALTARFGEHPAEGTLHYHLTTALAKLRVPPGEGTHVVRLVNAARAQALFDPADVEALRRQLTSQGEPR